MGCQRSPQIRPAKQQVPRRLFELMSLLEERHTSERHFYLTASGIEPTLQAQGITALMP